MREWQSQSHVRWYCRYHVVWVPKYRKRVIFGQMRRGIGRIVRELCQRHGVELIEGHALSDHVHILLGIPPKFSVANTVGFLKGKSAIRIHREYLGRLAQPPASVVAALRADEASGPPQPLQVVQAVRIGAEPGLELAHGPRIVRASMRAIHRPSLHRSG